MSATLDRPPSTRRLVVIAGAVAVLGLASTRIGYASFEFRLALLALLAGVVVAVLGLWTWRGVPASRIGPLLVLCAVAWYLPGLRWAPWALVADLAAVTTVLWAAVLGHAVLTWPDGVTRRNDVRLAVAALYAASFVPASASSFAVAGVLAVGLAATTVRDGTRQRQARRWALGAGALLVAVLMVIPLLPPVWIGAVQADVRPLTQVAQMACAAILAVALQRRAVGADQLMDLVVGLGQASGAELPRQLGAVLGDPTLQIGFWYPPVSRYVDPRGRLVQLPATGTDRSVEHLAADGRPVAVLVHDPLVAVAPFILAAIGRGASLWTSNAALQAELLGQVAQLRASRDRLATAVDEERADLARDLHLGIDPYLERLEQRLWEANADPSADIATLIVELAEIRHDLTDLADGIHPRLLSELGLAGALEALVRRSAVPVSSRIRLEEELDSAVAASLLFVTSESLTNVARHAGASHVTLQLGSDDAAVWLEITDDGGGGADPSRGTGLAGLRDRVEALDGRFAVEDRLPCGTRVVVRLPRHSGDILPTGVPS